MELARRNQTRDRNPSNRPVPRSAGVRRVLPYEFIDVGSPRLPVFIQSAKLFPEIPKNSRRSAGGQRPSSHNVIWHSVPVPTQSEIQRQSLQYLPIILLKENAGFIFDACRELSEGMFCNSQTGPTSPATACNRTARRCRVIRTGNSAGFAFFTCFPWWLCLLIPHVWLLIAFCRYRR